MKIVGGKVDEIINNDDYPKLYINDYYNNNTNE